MNEKLFIVSANDAKWEAIARMTEMRDRGVAAFIGPGNKLIFFHSI